MEKSKIAALASLGISLALAGWLSTFILSDPRGTHVKSLRDVTLSQVEKQLSILSHRIEALEEEKKKQQGQGNEPIVPMDTTGESSILMAIESLEERLSGIEDEIIEGLIRKPEPEGPATEGPSPQFMIDAMHGYQSQFLDSSFDLKDRAEALDQLREFPESVIARTPQVIEEALNLIQTTTDSRMKAKLIAGLERVDTEGVRNMLFHALRNEKDENVRWRALRNLEFFIEDPAIQEEVRAAFNLDTSGKVRRMAAMILDRVE